MQRLLIAFFSMGCLLMAGSVNAQSVATATTPTTATVSAVAASDTSQLKQYVGNYTVATGDIKQIIVTVERGKLVGEAVGLGQSSLLPNLTQRDAFTIPDPNGGADAYGTVQFGRDNADKVAKVILIVQGQTIEGIRTN